MKQKSLTSLITAIALSIITISMNCMDATKNVKKILLQISLSEPLTPQSRLSKEDKHYNKVFGLPYKASKSSWFFRRYDVEFYKVDAILINKHGSSYTECTESDFPSSKIAKNHDCCNDDFKVKFPSHIHASLLEPLLATTSTNFFPLENTQFAEPAQICIQLKELNITKDTLNQRLWIAGGVIVGTFGVCYYYSSN